MNSRQVIITMDKWLNLERENRKAARELFESKYYRSSVSRAYYAVFSKVNSILVTLSVNMPRDREGAKHRKIPMLIETKFTSIEIKKRQAISRIVTQLYSMRIFADYCPSQIVSQKEGRIAIACMEKAIKML